MPLIDVYKENGTVVVKAELTGIKKEDVEVNLAGSNLTIKGDKKEDKEVKEDHYYRRERSCGSFLEIVALLCEAKKKLISVRIDWLLLCIWRFVPDDHGVCRDGMG